MNIRMLLIGVGMAAMAAAQEVDLDFLKPLEAKAAESSVVELGPEQLGMLKGLGADVAAGPEISALSGLKRVRVRSYEFDKKGAYSLAELETFKAKVKGSGNWTSLISVKERGGEFTEVLTHRAASGESPDGMLIIVAEDDELTVVNIVGTIDLRNLGKIAGSMGIPGLSGSGEGKGEKGEGKPGKKQEEDN